jgi:hypothetical protein
VSKVTVHTVRAAYLRVHKGVVLEQADWEDNLGRRHGRRDIYIFCACRAVLQAHTGSDARMSQRNPGTFELRSQFWKRSPCATRIGWRGDDRIHICITGGVGSATAGKCF